jgi:hypothetical protein
MNGGAITIGRRTSNRRISARYCGENQSRPRARASVCEAVSWNAAR